MAASYDWLGGEEKRRAPNFYDQDAEPTIRRIEKCPSCQCIAMVAICWALYLKDHDHCGILVCIVCRLRASDDLSRTWRLEDWLRAA